MSDIEEAGCRATLSKRHSPHLKVYMGPGAGRTASQVHSRDVYSRCQVLCPSSVKRRISQE